MPNCGGLAGSDHRRAEHLSARQAGLLSFIAPTSRAESARYGAPTVFSSPPVECFSTERSAVEGPAVQRTSPENVFRQSEAQWRDLLFPFPVPSTYVQPELRTHAEPGFSASC